jgi:3-hydroxyacyl-CoA dehydrogenase
MIEAIKTVGVLGLGVMGFDIAFLYAQKGYRTLVYDASSSAMDNVVARRDQTIERLKRRNRISEAESANAKSGLNPAPGLAGMVKADLITEAVSESGEAPAIVDLIAVEGLKFPRGPLAEIDDLGADSVLKDLQKVNDAMPERKMKAPELLIAMAGEGQTFFNDGQANPWIAAFVEGRSHARH